MTLDDLIDEINYNNNIEIIDKRFVIFSNLEKKLKGNMPILKIEVLKEEYRIYNSAIVWEEIMIPTQISDWYDGESINYRDFTIRCFDR